MENIVYGLPGLVVSHSDFFKRFASAIEGVHGGDNLIVLPLRVLIGPHLIDRLIGKLFVSHSAHSSAVDFGAGAKRAAWTLGCFNLYLA